MTVADNIAVIYARYSSDRQRAESIEQQVDICTAYCAREGLTVARVYSDRAMSGRTADRPEFLQMVEDAKHAPWSKVVVYKLDRFSRDRYDSAIYRKRLADCGVSVVSATEGIPDSPEGRLLESVITGVAEWYSADLSQKVTRGMRANAEKCLANGQVVFGYDIVDGRYVINETEAEVVRGMFDQRARGVSFRQIAEELMLRGYQGEKGQRSTNWVKRRIEDERYIGVYHWGEVRIPDGMPPIVDRGTFESAQGIQPRKHSTRRTHDYPLSGKLFDARTGARFGGYCAHNGKGREYRYYSTGRGENRITLPANVIERSVVRIVRDALSTDEMIRTIAERMVADSDARKANAATMPERQMLSAARRERTNLIDHICRYGGSEALSDRLTALEERIWNLQATIEVAEQSGTATVDDAMRILRKLAGNLSEKFILDETVRWVEVERSTMALRVALIDDGNRYKETNPATDGEVRTFSGWWTDCSLHTNFRTETGLYLLSLAA